MYLIIPRPTLQQPSFNLLIFSQPKEHILCCILLHPGPGYFYKAIHACKVAVTCEAAPVFIRFRSAKERVILTDSRHDLALDAYRSAVQFLPRLAMLGLDLLFRHHTLTSGSDGLARDAAAGAIRSRQYGKAAELLEEGRAVL